MTGRPTIFSQSLCDTICARLIEGESLKAICRDDAMPSAGTVCRWLGEPDKAAFRDQYARAREAQADVQFDEMLEIADDAKNDWMEKHHGETVSWVENGEAIQRSKLRIETRKWTTGRMKPKVYGDKILAEVDSNVTINVLSRALNKPTP